MLKRLTAGVLLTGAITLSSAQGAWTKQASGTPNTLYGVVWTGAQFVAVGRSPQDGTQPATIITSPDGVTWSARAAGTNNGLTAVARNGSQVVAVGYSGAITLSTDGGSTWQARPSGTTQHLNAVAWAGSQFVAAGYNGTVATSPDGVTWTVRPSANTSTRMFGVAGSGSRIVVVGEGGYIQSSPDGIAWTTQSSGTGNILSAVTWTGTQFVAVTQSAFAGTLPSPVLTSPDGITWTAHANTLNAVVNAILWTGAQYVLVGGGGLVATSPDAATWTAQKSGATTVNLFGITITGAGTVLAAVGSAAVGENAAIITSVVGSTAIWTPGAPKTRVPSGARAVPGTIEGYRPDGRVPAP